MNGPYKLSEDEITKNIPGSAVGVYMLSRGGQSPHYVGRSNGDLASRLRSHLQEPSEYKEFWFETVSSQLEAYSTECKWYHKYNPPDNANHPAVPAGATWKCPVEGCRWS